ncbi:hypothetical protein JD844_013495, partial [Phrynosoma platyrhinos]
SSFLFQVNYAHVSGALDGKIWFPFLYRMMPKDEILYLGLVRMLLHFRWTWIGLIVLDNDNGERFLRALMPLLSRSGISVAFTQRIPEISNHIIRIDISKSNWELVNVYLYYAEMESFSDSTYMIQLFVKHLRKPIGKVLIITAMWDITVDMFLSNLDNKHINAFISFFMKKRSSIVHTDLKSFCKALKRFLEEAFYCSYSKHALSVKGFSRCRQKETLETVPKEFLERILSLDNYITYSTVWALAHALHAAYSSRSKRMLTATSGSRMDFQRVQAWQLHPFLRTPQFHNTSRRDGVYLNPEGELAAEFDLINWLRLPNRTFLTVTFGHFQRQGSADYELDIAQDDIVRRMWLNQTFYPKSLPVNTFPWMFLLFMVKPCPSLDVLKVVTLDIPSWPRKESLFAAFSVQKDADYCNECPHDQTFLFFSDADHCHECADDQYSNKDHDQCVAKVVSFLSYGEPLGIALAFFALFLSLAQGLC